MDVELLLSPRCPNAAAARSLLAECLRRSGLDVEVRERVGDHPSPTILIDGVDVMTARSGAPPGPACRLDLPTAERVLAALRPEDGSRTGQAPSPGRELIRPAGRCVVAITIRRPPHERQTVVAISGAVTATAVPAVRRALTKALRTGAPILVDLTRVTAIHRAGLAALVAAQRRAERAGTSLLLDAQPAQIRTLLAAFGIPSEEPHSPTRAMG